MKYWRQTVKDFGQTNDVERDQATANLGAYAIIMQDYAGFENFFLDDTNRDKPESHRWIADNLANRAYNLFAANNFDRKKVPTPKELDDERKAYVAYFKSTKPWWEKANDVWGYYSHQIHTLTHFYPDKAERDQEIANVVAWLKTMPDKAQANDHYAQLVDWCREGRAFETARLLIAQITDPAYAGYKEAEILASEGKWEPYAKQLETVEGMGNPFWADRAVNERARVYREILNKQPEAIALYERINKPPGTLWGIQECYKRMNKLPQAMTTLAELENLFPTEAPALPGPALFI